MDTSDWISITAILASIITAILLSRGDSFEIGAWLYIGRKNPVPIIKFIWDDKYAENNEREQVLEF
jgi:hypothetical protein